MVLEVLDSALVLLGRSARAKRSQVSSLARLRIELARVQAVFAVRKLPDHNRISLNAAAEPWAFCFDDERKCCKPRATGTG